LEASALPLDPDDNPTPGPRIPSEADRERLIATSYGAIATGPLRRSAFASRGFRAALVSGSVASEGPKGVPSRLAFGRSPKNRGPFHLVPVIRKAISDRLEKVSSTRPE
jgi:hypothetical protein